MRTSGQAPRVLLVDAGYFSDANVTALQTLGSEPLIARRSRGMARGCSARTGGVRQRARPSGSGWQRRLQPPRGRRLYARRKAIVEPMFGLIKRAGGFRQFLLRGLAKVQTEWTLICLAQNLLTLYRSGRRIPAYRWSGRASAWPRDADAPLCEVARALPSNAQSPYSENQHSPWANHAL